MISSTPHSEPRRTRAGGFTLVEVLVAATIGVFVLAGVLAANLQVVRSGVSLTRYVEMDAQVRRALDFLSRDLRVASGLTWNGASDLTLTLPAGAGTTRVTYAWTAASGTFFRVAGASSAVLAGRLELVRDIPALPDGSPGLTFARFDRDGAAAATDAATKRIQINLTAGRRTGGPDAAGRHTVSATFILRSKP
jgi:Tfp pilus assembly protein PilW